VPASPQQSVVRATVISKGVDPARKRDIGLPTNWMGAPMLRPANSKPTVIVTERGEIAPDTPRVSYRRGFADLLDFASPPVRIAILSPDAPTAIGLARTGHAMREAMAAFGKGRP
jgi:hypothetical protein